MISASSSTSSKGADCLQNYDILEEIGCNQYVTTYLANSKRGRTHSRAMVIRQCKGLTSTDSHQHHRSLYHPSIVSVYSLFNSPTASFQVIEMCSGGSLADLLYSRRDRKLSEDEVSGVMRGLADALLYLKKAGIMHRTIRPSCILFGADSRVKLSGFDFATQFPSKDINKAAFDIAAQYIAPEIISGIPHDNSADVWSYGCLLFTCVAGRSPFEGKIPSQVFQLVLSGKYVLPAGISVSLRQCLTKALHTDPERRISLTDLVNSTFMATQPHHSSNPLLKTSPSLSRDSVTKQDHVARLRAEVLSSKTSPPTRIVSDPIPRRKVTIGSVTNFPTGRRAVSGSSAKHTIDEPSETVHASVDEAPVIRAIKPKNEATVTKSMKRDMLPGSSTVGETRPGTISTDGLKPRVHRTISGQITILPSRSLLVDFREGERRKGQKGDQVLIVSQSGSHVDVFSAPRLSVPMCVVEPAFSYSLDSLPSKYWKSLNDAAELIERIKQRTTKLVSFDNGVRYSLMANGPPGDIELLFLSDSTQELQKNEVHTPNARMRLRLLRRTRTLEFSQRVETGHRGVEWTKRVLHTAPDFTLATAEVKVLSDEELKAMTFLYQFLRVCDTSESVSRKTPSSSSPPPVRASTLAENPRKSLGLGRPSTTNRVVTASSAATKVFSGVDLPPRPRKFSNAHLGPTPQTPSESLEACQGTLSDVLKSFDIAPLSGFDSRFIDDIGWCIRHNSRVSQGGRYQVLYLDGSMLEVDADEEWLCYTAADGMSSRHSIRRSPSHPLVVAQLRVFEKFLSSFNSNPVE